MQEKHLDHHRRLAQCLKSIGKIDDIRARSTLFKIYHNVSQAYCEMDKEMVECRRTQRVTLKYTELETKFNQAVTEFEQWTLMATLMY